MILVSSFYFIVTARWIILSFSVQSAVLGDGPTAVLEVQAFCNKA
jgi:hypothetical protein